MQPQHYKKRPTRLLLMILVAAIASVIGIFLALTSDSGLSFVGWIVPILCIPGVIAWALQFKKSPDALILTNDGFHDYSSAAGLGAQLVPWEQVSEIKLGRNPNEISIMLYNADRFYDTIGSSKKRVTAMSRKLGYGDVIIPITMIAGVPNGQREHLIQEMHRYRENRHRQMGLIL